MKLLYSNLWPGSVADPGFPIGGGGGGAEPLGGGGAPTSDVSTFRQKCMRKRKNWILLGGGGASAAPPRRSANENGCVQTTAMTHDGQSIMTLAVLLLYQMHQNLRDTFFLSNLCTQSREKIICPTTEILVIVLNRKQLKRRNIILLKDESYAKKDSTISTCGHYPKKPRTLV